MIEVSNTTAQTLTPGQSITFDAVILKSGCGEAHRRNSGVVTLRANNATYELHFAGNITGTAAGPVQLAIELDGEPLQETTMMIPVQTAGNVSNVSTATLVRTCDGCCGHVTVTNTGTSSVVVEPNSAFFVKRVA